MFKLNEYKVTFRHVQLDRKALMEAEAEGIIHTPYAEKTICAIYKMTEPYKSPVAVGIAMCSLKDNFDKAKGRELAFSRAMHQIATGKEARLVWWKAFWVNDDGKWTKGAAGACARGVLSIDEIMGGHLDGEL